MGVSLTKGIRNAGGLDYPLIAKKAGIDVEEEKNMKHSFSKFTDSSLGNIIPDYIGFQLEIKEREDSKKASRNGVRNKSNTITGRDQRKFQRSSGYLGMSGKALENIQRIGGSTYTNKTDDKKSALNLGYIPVKKPEVSLFTLKQSKKSYD